MVRVASAQRMIPEKRNRKVKISKSRLKQIILEEYIKEEALEEYAKEFNLDEVMTQEKADEFVAWIKKEGPKPEWLEREYGPGSYKRGKQTPANDSNVDRSAETMPLPTDDMPQYDDEYDEEGAYDPEAEAAVSDVPSDDAPESDYGGFQDRAGPPLEDRVVSLVQELPPEEMLDLFTAVIEKLAPEYIEPQRRRIGFEEVKAMIKEVFDDYQDFEASYDVMKGESPPETNTPTKEAPDDYEKLMTTYHALEDAVKHHPELQSALDNVANILDGLDTGDSLGRANENLKDV